MLFKMNKNHLLIFLFSMLVITNVNYFFQNKNHDKLYHTQIPKGNDIDPILEQYVRRFIEEGEKRGHHFNPQHIHVKANNFLELKCRCDGLTIAHDSLIYIDPNTSNWILDPEFLVYHELGHLLLNRNHRDVLVNGYALSLMHTSAIIGQLNKTELRQRYVDELFDSTNVNQLISDLHKVEANPNKDIIE